MTRLVLQRPIRCWIMWIALAAAGGVWADSVIAASPLVSRQVAARNGLKRAWFVQMGVDPARSEVSRWLLTTDRLYGVTTSGATFAIDTQTGSPLWIRQISPPGRAAFGPSANRDYVAVVSGSKLYLLDQHDGQTRWIHDLGSAPGAGPSLTESYGFVAMVTGRIEGYKLNSPDAEPWYYQSKGRAFSQPTATGKVISWPTDQGYLYVASADGPRVLYRLETDAEIVASPAYMASFLYVASLDGYLYCIDEISGAEAWRFSTGYPVQDAPAVVGERAYVGSIEPAMYAVDATTGVEQWRASGYTQFAAQGKNHVYVADRYGNLATLDAETGRLAGHLRVGEGVHPLVNDQTDRIFLVSKHGLVQCLHEIGVDEPVIYRSPFEVDEEEETGDDVAAPEEASDDPGNVFEDAVEQAPEEPAGDEPEDEDPAFFEDFNPFE